VSMSLMQMVGAAGATAPRSAASAAASSAATAASTSSSTAPGVDLTNTFLQLLSVQLANQSPLDPVDPNQFTVELAQFDSLGELTQIQSLMQQLVNDVNPNQTAGGAAAAGAASPTSTSPTNSISH
jgi:flagellar basal-body rod modification protein FlgD